jgi:hypothetical protein
MNTENDPGGGILKPVLRMNSTLMQRVRDSQYQGLKARARAGILKGFAFAHLKQGIEGENVDWVDSKEPESVPTKPNAKTECGIRRDVQELLAGIRTDLDSFSDIEAYALMTSGCCAIEAPVKQYLKEFSFHSGGRVDWKFLQVEPAMKQDKAEGEALAKLKRNLEAGSKTFGKVWKLHRGLNYTIKALGTVLLLYLVYIGYTEPEWQPFAPLLTWLGDKMTIGTLMWSFAGLLIIWLANFLLGTRKGKVIKKAMNYRDLPWRIIVGTSIGLVGWVGAFIHLHCFDKMFKKMGKVE